MADDEASDHDATFASRPAEGVQIFGAQPAGDPRVVRWPDDGPSWSSDPSLADDDDDATPAGDRADAGEATMALPVFDDEPEPGVPDAGASGEARAAELPHWSEPPTGVVPAIFDQDDAEERDDWGVLSGGQARFRSDAGDWDSQDFAEELAAASGDDDLLPRGAIGERQPDPNDSDEQFAAAVAQRRRGGEREIETSRRSRSQADDASGETARTGSSARPPRVPRAPRTPRAPQPGVSGRARAAGPRAATNGDPFGELDAAGRNLPVAVTTAALLAVAAIVCFVAGPAYTVVLAGAIIGAAAAELVGTLHRKNLRTAPQVVIAGSFFAPLAAYSHGAFGLVLVTVLVTITTLLWFLVEAGPGRPVIGIAVTLLAFGWVGGLGGFAGLLLHHVDGVQWFLAALLPTVTYDVFGYFIGQQFGRTPVAPRVSPHKTLEGTLGGLVTALLIPAAILVWKHAPFTEHSSWAVFVCLLAGVAAFLGDLCESLIKRDLGIKDFSATLPGHGGILDRFDGLLFTMPVVYLLSVYFISS